MSEVSLKAIDITNFMQIEHATQKLDDLGLVLIRGENVDDSSATSNGAGKSTIADAICWVLFGVTARGASADRVINRKAGKGTKVELFLTSGGDEYLLMRHRKHKTGKNRIHLHRNGDDITGGTDAVTQDMIARIIGCSLEVFVASIYAGQEAMPNLPQMTDKNLKVIVEESSGVTILQEAHEVALKRRRDAEKVFTRETDERTRLAASAKGLKARWEDDKAAKQEWTEVWVEEVRDAKLAVEDIQSEIDALPPIPSSEKIDRIIEQVEAKIKEMRASRPDDSEVEAAKEAFHDAKMTLQVDSDILRNMENRVKRNESLVGSKCSECGRIYDEDHLEKALEASRENCERARNAMRDSTAQKVAAERALSDAQSAFLTAQKLVDTTELEGKLAKVRKLKETNQYEVNKRVSLDVRLANAKKAAERVEAQVNPHVAHVERSAKELKSAARALTTQKLTLQKAEDDFKVTKELTEIFSPKGVRGQILDNVLPFLNDRTATYLGTLSDGNITAEWKTIKENAKGEEIESFHISVDHALGGSDFIEISGGERRKVRIATAMALQDLVAGRADNPIKIFIADEVDDALDDAGLERLMTIFEEKARAVGTVFIISHNDIGDWVRNQIVVRKEGGSSTIVEM